MRVKYLGYKGSKDCASSNCRTNRVKVSLVLSKTRSVSLKNRMEKEREQFMTVCNATQRSRR